MSLRLRIALLMAVLTAGATVAVGVVSYRSTSGRLMEAVDDSLVEVTAVVTARRFDERLFESGPFDGFVLQAVLADGSVVRTNFPGGLEPAHGELDLVGRQGVTSFRSVKIDRQRYRIRSIGFDDGIIQIGRPLRETDAVLASLRMRTLLLVVAVTIVAGGVGALTAGRMTRRLRRLTDAATEIETTGRLDVELQSESGRRDEVGLLSNAFARMVATLSRSQADQRRLVQDAGHELRTPVTAIRTSVETLGRYPDMSPESRLDIIETMRAETAELTALVNEVVQVASGELDDVDPELVSLHEVVESAARRVTRRSGREISIESDSSRVVVRRDAVERSVSNLLDNAVKFDASNEPIQVEVVNGRVSVCDRGPGVADDDKPLIFDRFHRAASARTLPGSGLGLSMVAQMARTAGGDVFVTDREGGGSVIGFWIPAEVGWAPPTT